MSVDPPPALGKEALLLIQSEFRPHRPIGGVGDFEGDPDSLACQIGKMNDFFSNRKSNYLIFHVLRMKDFT